MTNAEKFKEVFGFKPDRDACFVHDDICIKIQESGIMSSCEDCAFHGFMDKEYKPCFRMREDFDDGK